MNDKFLHHWHCLEKKKKKGIKVSYFHVARYSKYLNINFKGSIPAYKNRHWYSPGGISDVAHVNLDKNNALRPDIGSPIQMFFHFCHHIWTQ